MSYPTVQIGDLALDEPGSFKIGPFGSSLKKDELVSSGIPVIGIENILPNDFVPSYRKYITEKKYQDLSQYTVKPGDIAVTTMGTIGRAAVIPDNIGTAIIDSHLFRMRVNQTKVYPPYLCYAINGAPSVINHLEQNSRGAIMDGLNTTILKESPLALPPLTEQKRIASLLARADRLRALRRTAHDLGESLLQSVFLEMFGDPQFNEKKWDLVTLGEKITFMTSGSRGWAEHYSNEGDLFLRIQNVGANELLLDDVAYVKAPDTAESKRTRVQPGDLLISATADLGRTAVIPENFPTAYINQHLFLLRLKDLNPVFVAGYFSTESGKAQILRLDREGVKSGLNFDDARSLTVFNPPLNLQEEFAGVVARVESLRGRMSESTRQVEGLFESLLNQNFGG